jgi:CRISPR-associated protein Csm4
LNWFRVKFELKAWFASAWQSDTIFGHLCWAMRYLHGEGKLRHFLQLYDDGAPPLLLSNGFPGELLPKPATPPPPIESDLPLEQQRERFRQYKQARRGRYIPLSEFNRAISGQPTSSLASADPGEMVRVTLKNQLNRVTTTTDEEHPLYNFEERYWAEATVYLKISDDFVDTARELFQYIAQTGYGKRKSVGYGQIESMSFQPFDGFRLPHKPNGFVTLSNFVPARNDPIAGFWNLTVKYGKMGEEWASEDHAFKKPLLMLEAGSTFFDPAPRDYYGRLVKTLNPAYTEAVQYAFALPVPMVVAAPQVIP